MTALWRLLSCCALRPCQGEPTALHALRCATLSAGHKVFSVAGVSLLPLGAAVGVSQQKESPVEKRYR